MIQQGLHHLVKIDDRVGDQQELSGIAASESPVQEKVRAFCAPSFETPLHSAAPAFHKTHFTATRSLVARSSEKAGLYF